MPTSSSSAAVYLPGSGDRFLICTNDLLLIAYVAGCGPYNVHDLAHFFPVLDLCYTDLAQHSHNGRLGSTKQMIKVVISPTCVRPSFRHCTESTRAMTLDRVQRRKYNTSAEREEISSSSSSSPIGLDNFSQERKDRRPKRIAYLYLHGHRNIKRYGPFELGEARDPTYQYVQNTGAGGSRPTKNLHALFSASAYVH